MQPSMEACAWIHQAQDRSWGPYLCVLRCGHAYITVACVLPWQVFQRWRLQSPEGRLSRDGNFNRRRGLYSQAVLPKMPGASSFPRPAATVSQARWRDGNNFHGGATTGFSPREDYGRLLPLPLQDLLQAGRKCRRRRGLGRSSKDLNRRSCPYYRRKTSRDPADEPDVLY
jgi:hypothetical protein